MVGSGSKKKTVTREQLLSSRLIFGTYAMVLEGTDLPHLDTLVMTTPLTEENRLIQLIGRVLRKEDPDHQPLVLDVADQVSCFQNQAFRRGRFYRKQGYHRLPLIDHYLDPMAKIKAMGKEKKKKAPTPRYNQLELPF